MDYMRSRLVHRKFIIKMNKTIDINNIDYVELIKHGYIIWYDDKKGE